MPLKNKQTKTNYLLISTAQLARKTFYNRTEVL